MFQQNNTDEPESHDQAAERQTNYLILRTLEQKLEPKLFKELLPTVTQKLDLPSHTAWDGQALPLTYEQLKASHASSDCRLLTQLVKCHSSKKFENFEKPQADSLSLHLKKQLAFQGAQSTNLYSALHRKLARHHKLEHKTGGDCAFSNFERIKTVFCHTDFSTDEVSAIYNVYFDQSGEFIVSAGDEGIIKVWDRNTLMLQASLHGHDDYITEIDISKCNKYIASAGKDAQIIIWELATGKILYRLTHHTKLINCVKFFTPPSKASGAADQTAQQQQQYLFSCSDDGTVRVYDFTQVSGWRQSRQSQQQQESNQTQKTSAEEEFRLRRSQRQQRPAAASNDEGHSEQDLYTIELTPDDFRPGTRNKKLDTLVMNHSGLIVAGSSSGELLVWRLNYDLIQKRVPKQDCQKFLGQFKMSKQSCVKFCEFSPRHGVQNMGDMLMTGSVDGVVNLWNMSVPGWKSYRDSTFSLEDNSRLILSIDEAKGCFLNNQVKSTDSQGNESIDHFWEEAEGTFRFKESIATSKSVCDAVRWSVHGRFAIASIQCHLEGEGIDICKVKIWDTVEKKYIEDLARLSSIRLPQNTFVLAPHPKKEEVLITGSDNGVLVLWNLHTKQLIKQFKQFGVYSVDANIMDNPLHGSWSPDGQAFITGNGLGTISLYSNKIVAHQYEATRVQQFFMYDIQRQSDNPFEKINERPTICSYNMVPYEVQPEKFKLRFTEPRQEMTSANFQRSHMIAKELGILEEKYYQDKLQSSLFNSDDLNNMLQPMESIQYSEIQPPAGENQQDADMTDLQMLDDLQPNIQNNQQANQPRRARPSRSRLIPNNGRQTSSIEIPDSERDQSHNQLNSDEESLSSEQDDSDPSDQNVEVNRGGRLRRNVNGRQNNAGHVSTRPARAARPANLRDIETVGDNSVSGEVPGGRATNRRRRGNRGRNISSENSDESDSVQENDHRQQNGTTSRRYQRNQQRQRRPRHNVDDSSSEQEQQQRRQNKSVRKKHADSSEDEYMLSAPKVNQRISSYLSDNELEPENEDKIDFTSHMLIAANKQSNQKQETKYDLAKTSSNQSTKGLICRLCERSDGEIVGPFTKAGCPDKLFLHKECIEVNTYSYYSTQSRKWVNIDQMMKSLSQETTYKCFRCDKPGASVSCQLCGKNFHGYLCAQLYLLKAVPETSQNKNEGVNPQTWQCFFCQNYHNLSMHQTTPRDEKNYMQTLRKIDKSYLLHDQSFIQREFQSNKAITYSPQVDDVVVYFFQGHEDFIYQYNCHFYAGYSKVFPKRQMTPWLSSQNLKKVIASSPFMVCKVLSVKTLFPSMRSLRLIQQFGSDASDCPQTPQIIQRIEMQFIGNCSDKFVVDLFPNELPDFMILYQKFISQWTKYKKFGSLVGKEVQVKLKSRTQKMKVVEESPFESQFCPDSLWLNIVCTPIHQIDATQRRQQVQSQGQDETTRVNFWNINFAHPQPEDLHGFSEIEHSKLKQSLSTYMTKHREYLIYFKERVQEQIAPEYRQIIPGEMWFDLVMQRLNKKYYRSSRHFYAELDQIVTNAQVYNGQEHEVAIDAGEIVKRFRMESQKFIDLGGDKQVKERGQDALIKFQSLKDSFEDAQALIETAAVQATDKIVTHNNVVTIEEGKDDEVPVATLGYQRLTGKRLRTNRGRAIDDHSPDIELLSNSTPNAAHEGGVAGTTRTQRKRQRQI